MGRDYPVEHGLDTLFEGGFAEGCRAARGVVEPRCLIPAGERCRNCHSRMGRDYPLEHVLDTLFQVASPKRCRASRVVVEPRFSSLPGSAIALCHSRMGRDYPLEHVLDTLYESGFAQTLSRFARGSRTKVLIPAGERYRALS